MGGRRSRRSLNVNCSQKLPGAGRRLAPTTILHDGRHAHHLRMLSSAPLKFVFGSLATSLFCTRQGNIALHIKLLRLQIRGGT